MCVQAYYAYVISERIPKKLIALVDFERKVTWLGNKEIRMRGHFLLNGTSGF